MAGHYIRSTTSGHRTLQHVRVKTQGLCAILGEAPSARGRAGMSCSVAEHSAAIFACPSRRAQAHARSFVEPPLTPRPHTVVIFFGDSSQSHHGIRACETCKGVDTGQTRRPLCQLAVSAQQSQLLSMPYESFCPGLLGESLVVRL